MVQAVLIGFYYEHRPIPGVFVDLFKAYMACIRFCSRVTVLTDKHQPVLPPNIIDQIAAGQVDGEILGFPQRDISYRAVANYSQLESELCALLPQDDHILLYYSGHGVRDALIMPDGESIPVTHIRSLLTGKMRPHGQLFFILDCCHTCGLYLPYKLSFDRFRLTDDGRLTTSRILLITATQEDQKAVSTQRGSLFSELLFQELTAIIYQRNTPDLRRLIADINKSMKPLHPEYPQTATIYSSHPMLPVLWGWLSCGPLRLDVDPGTRCLQLQTNPLRLVNQSHQGD